MIAVALTASASPGRADPPTLAVLGPAAGAPVSLDVLSPAAAPYILSPADSRRYRDIFAAQDRARWGRADRLIDTLQDRRLMGHVLYQRYMHPTEWRSTYAELSHWLERYADQPGAPAIHALAQARRAPGDPEPPAPRHDGLRLIDLETTNTAPCAAARPGPLARRLAGEVREMLRETMPSRARSHLRRHADQVTETEYDRVAADIAAGYFLVAYEYPDVLEDALALAEAAAERSPGLAPRADWIAGLIHWRAGRHGTAARHFQALATSECATAWGRSAGAYWAARAHLRQRNLGAVTLWLERAALEERTFYGLIAQRALGTGPHLSPGGGVLTRRAAAALAADPRGRRALALVQVGRGDLAVQELGLLPVALVAPTVLESAMTVLSQVRMPDVALRLGLALEERMRSPELDTALYPLAPWSEDDTVIDQALLHAIVRQESKFDPDAVSHAGARGLMQLMPATALSLDRRARGRRLLDPDVNLRLGQQYLEWLMGLERVGDSLIHMLIAYNAGPGNLARWDDGIDHGGDPLLFMEMVPSREARSYAERVLTGFWIYRNRLGQPTPSLDAIAAGGWPRYVRLDGAAVQVAAGAD